MNKLVLLAEDDKFQQMIEINIFQQLGYTVLLAENGQQAIEIFAKNYNTIQLIVLDLQMPIKDGFQAAIEIQQLQKQNGSKVKIYGLSADDDDETLEKALDSGMKSLLKKPIQKNSIQQIF